MGSLKARSGVLDGSVGTLATLKAGSGVLDGSVGTLGALLTLVAGSVGLDGSVGTLGALVTLKAGSSGLVAGAFLSGTGRASMAGALVTELNCGDGTNENGKSERFHYFF